MQSSTSPRIRSCIRVSRGLAEPGHQSLVERRSGRGEISPVVATRSAQLVPVRRAPVRARTPSTRDARRRPPRRWSGWRRDPRCRRARAAEPQRRGGRSGAAGPSPPAVPAPPWRSAAPRRSAARPPFRSGSSRARPERDDALPQRLVDRLGPQLDLLRRASTSGSYRRSLRRSFWMARSFAAPAKQLPVASGAGQGRPSPEACQRPYAGAANSCIQPAARHDSRSDASVARTVSWQEIARQKMTSLAKTSSRSDDGEYGSNI